jgi:hypothetical protein
MRKLLLSIFISTSIGVLGQENPFEKYGYKPTIATLSNGKFNEFHDRDTIVQIGHVWYNTLSKKIIGFVDIDSARSEEVLEADLVSRWISPDPLASWAPGWSPYRYGFDNPINFTDPTGLWEDWVQSESGDIYWDDNATSQETTKKGETYLGKAVVVFEGSENERLGKGNNLFGEGANLAKATVYGPKGADDIKEYGAYTMSSDPSKYGTVADGEYTVYFDKVGKSGALKSNWAIEGRGRVPAREGFNPAFPSRDPAYLEGVFIHRSNNNGYAGGGVSQGCPLICPSFNNPGNGWDEFNQQLHGVTQFKMILNRDKE